MRYYLEIGKTDEAKILIDELIKLSRTDPLDEPDMENYAWALGVIDTCNNAIDKIYQAWNKKWDSITNEGKAGDFTFVVDFTESEADLVRQAVQSPPLHDIPEEYKTTLLKLEQRFKS